MWLWQKYGTMEVLGFGLMPVLLKKERKFLYARVFCEMPEMVSFRNDLISDIVQWLEKMNTQPHLLSMIVSALVGDLEHIRTQEHIWWRPIKRAFMTIPQILLLQGFLPKGLDVIQQDYYSQKGSRRTSKTWLKMLCEKLIQVAHSLWNKRNAFEHDKRQHGLREIEDVRLEAAVKHQYLLGTDALNSSDKYLFNKSCLELWAQKGEYIRAWLFTVLIARVEYEEAKREMQNDRGNYHYHRKRATGTEIILQKRKRKEVIMS